MRFSGVALAALLTSQFASAAPTFDDEVAVADLAKQAYDKTREEVTSTPKRSLGGNACSLRNLRVRREWGTLSKKQRKNYIKAVKCLQSKPALTPSTVASGAKTRFDDFVVTHINQTMTIHYTANFLSWHRYYVWLYEEALREECGFTGDQPYWDWAKTARHGLLNSPVFDGSETSMSGDGESTHTANQTQIILGGSGGSGAPGPSGDAGRRRPDHGGRERGYDDPTREPAASPSHRPESWYRSSNLRGPNHLGDTGEIPVVRGRRDEVDDLEDADDVPLYPPPHWSR